MTDANVYQEFANEALQQASKAKAKTSSWPYTSLPSLGRKLRWQVTGFLGRVGIFRGPVAPIDAGQNIGA